MRGVPSARTGLVAAVLLLATVPGSASGAAAPDEQAQAIVNGEDESGMPHVASLSYWLGGDSGFSFCSANLITPRVLLTASHCVEELRPEDWPGIGVFFGRDVEEGGDWATVADIVTHPAYAGRDGRWEADIAVVVLNEAAPVEPSRFRMSPLTEGTICPGQYNCRTESNRREVLSVGFGNNTSGEGAGRKRSAWLTILGFGYASGITDDFLVTDDESANICYGDSGGPQFALEDEVWVQWGIHSWIPYGNCRQSEANSIRPDYYADWLLNRIGDVHGTKDVCRLNGYYEDGFCDPGCIDPDPDCATGCRASALPGGWKPARALPLLFLSILLGLRVLRPGAQRG